MVPEEKHVAHDLSEPERLDYLVAVATMVHAGTEIAESEVDTVRRLCLALGLPAERVEDVVAAAAAPDHARVDAILASYRGGALAYSLLTDAILVVFANGKVAPGESAAIAKMADALGINVAQTVMISRYVEGIVGTEDHSALSRTLAEGLADSANHVHEPHGVRWLYRKLTSNKPD